MAIAGIVGRCTSALAIQAVFFPFVDWLCADIICCPARLLKLVERWRAAGTVRKLTGDLGRLEREVTLGDTFLVADLLADESFVRLNDLAGAAMGR